MALLGCYGLNSGGSSNHKGDSMNSMKDTLIKTLTNKVRAADRRYKRLVWEYADQLEMNEKLKDTIALLMQEKGTR